MKMHESLEALLRFDVILAMKSNNTWSFQVYSGLYSIPYSNNSID